MKIQILTYTPLEIADIAIGKCWNKPNWESLLIDFKRVKRVGVDNKHASTLEHLVVYFETNHKKTLRKFKENNFSIVKKKIVTTNVRAIGNMCKWDVSKMEKYLPNTYIQMLSGETMTETRRYKESKDTRLLHTTGDTYHFEIRNISRALLQELARHRCASITVKSTRYTLQELKDEKTFKISNGRSVRLYDYDKVSKYCKLTNDNNVNLIISSGLEWQRVLQQLGISNDKTKFALPEAYLTELVWTVHKDCLANFLKLRDSKSAMWEIRELAQLLKAMI